EGREGPRQGCGEKRRPLIVVGQGGPSGSGAGAARTPAALRGGTAGRRCCSARQIGRASCREGGQVPAGAGARAAARRGETRWAFGDFFFQAEDGIRDFHVTGVQTCALPIYEGREGPRQGCGEKRRPLIVVGQGGPSGSGAGAARTPAALRGGTAGRRCCSAR